MQNMTHKRFQVDIVELDGKKDDVPVAAVRRLHVRFQCTLPLDTILSHSALFKVKKISLSGMVIQSEQALEINGLIRMDISLNAYGPINLSGRVVTRHVSKDNERVYEIGVEFTDLTDKDRTVLKALIDDLAKNLE